MVSLSDLNDNFKKLILLRYPDKKEDIMMIYQSINEKFEYKDGEV